MKGYVEVLLKEYQSNPQKNWVAKDVAMYIVMALAIRGSTRTRGATQINPFVKVMDFFQSQVLPELKSKQGNPVLKADCLKFIASFRTQLSADACKALIPLIAPYLGHKNFVVHSYAAASIEKLLSVKDNGQPRMNKTQLQPYIKPLLQGLFRMFQHDESKENEYGMKAIMRVCAVGEDAVTPCAEFVINQIKTTLHAVAQNPRNPKFNHFLFETLACLITNVCKRNPGAVEKFESSLFPPFQTMLQMETCQEFGPYVFQILSQLLEKHTKMTKPYVSIFPALLHPKMWANKGNIPAMIRLLVAYLRVDPSVVGQKLEGLLGIFQKLIANKREDHHGMALISAIVERMPTKAWGRHAPTFLQMMFQRLMNSRTQKFVCNFVSFSAFFCHKHGPDIYIQMVDQVQKGIFANLLGKVVVPNVQKVEGKVERKSCAVGMIDLLCKSKAMMSGPYPQIWPQLLTAIINLFELPETSTYENDDDIMDMSQRGFKTVYARLVFAPEIKQDPVGDVPNVKAYLAKSLEGLSRQMPNQFGGVIKQKLSPDHQKALLSYMKASGATLH
uniref:Exportin-2 n=1 Tax=Lotharella oceanica TaxID=641309 RepID=A0A7S2TRB0_9EUKA|mmetsp:Transcript_25729/g.48041  ORF Transcript_25729/g.48041 Transcript_25729/m.48041 type:complete len:559 (+) Transcript_25729:3-1679(+)